MKLTMIPLLLSAPLLGAAPHVQVERGRIEGASWRFPSIVSPRAGDLAESARLDIIAGELEKIGE